MRVKGFLVVVVVLCLAAPAWAQSEAAKAYRQSNQLVAYSPPPEFVDGLFTARQMLPRHLYKSPGALAKNLGCPTAWLMDEAEMNRLKDALAKGAPLEYSIYLEADCQGQLAYYVFVAWANLDPRKWLAGQKRFAGSKAEGQYGETVARLEKAMQAGLAVNAELRFVEGAKGLVPGDPEDTLGPQCRPLAVYDLEKGQPAGK